MKDLLDDIAKVAVWKAAIGDKAELVGLLRGGDPIPSGAREQLALLIEGKLVLKKRKRSRPVPEASPSIRIATYLHSPVWNAVREYRAEAKAWKRRGQFRGNARRLVEEIAQRYGVTPDALDNALRKGPRLPAIHTYETDEAAPFRRWLADSALLKEMLPKKRRK
jgi:hypothetical protein